MTEYEQQDRERVAAQRETILDALSHETDMSVSAIVAVTDIDRERVLNIVAMLAREGLVAHDVRHGVSLTTAGLARDKAKRAPQQPTLRSLVARAMEQAKLDEAARASEELRQMRQQAAHRAQTLSSSLTRLTALPADTIDVQTDANGRTFAVIEGFTFVLSTSQHGAPKVALCFECARCHQTGLDGVRHIVHSLVDVGYALNAFKDAPQHCVHDWDCMSIDSRVARGELTEAEGEQLTRELVAKREAAARRAQRERSLVVVEGASLADVLAQCVSRIVVEELHAQREQGEG